MLKLFFLMLVATSALPVLAARPFPDGPHAEMTPGSLCTTPSEYRYPEKIPYCRRDVDSETKQKVIAQYDAVLGYQIRQMNRGAFKIDHYIPLCMGGSNNADNLWPQHESVYRITDPLEQAACDKMAAGKLKQAEAVEIIKRAKADLSQAPQLVDRVRAL